MNTYSEAILRLQQAVARRGIHYSLDRLDAPLAELNTPHKALPPTVHVAGTNGKGSTSAFLSAALRHCGLTVGTYTSPHVTSYCERIAIDGTPISESDFCRYLSKIMAIGSAEQSSEFELLTLLSFCYFSDRRPDVVIVETGLGGRLDATNVIMPILSILTPIGLDHQDILGHDIRLIAAEKAGIIKPNIPVISAIQPPRAETVIIAAATANRSPLTVVAPWDSLPPDFQLTASYQRQNAAVADAAARHVLNRLGRADDHVMAGLAQATLWGRFTQYRINNHVVTIDGAHNAHGLSALFATLPAPRAVWMGMLKTKSLSDALAKLPPSVTTLYVYCPDPDRWHAPEDFQALLTSPVSPHSDVTQLPHITDDLLIT
ncbi:hypothetical protein EBZ35_08345, partial [bacterium]|nr:hypothetical protein [bacterium]